MSSILELIRLAKVTMAGADEVLQSRLTGCSIMICMHFPLKAVFSL